MEKKLFFLLTTLLFLSFFHFVFAQENFLKLPGKIEDKGTYFEIKNCDYLDITLESEKEISIILESIPRMISLKIIYSSDANSTHLTIKGLEPNKIYYKYQDSYKNGEAIFTDERGIFSWEQDLSKPHHIWIQEEKGTKFIRDDENGGDCFLIGEWNFYTKTCTLKTDLYETIQIESDGITIDGENHQVSGKDTGYGIFILEGKKDITIKNLKIEKFTYGIYFSHGINLRVNNNEILGSWYGVYLYHTSNSVIEDNLFSEILPRNILGATAIVISHSFSDEIKNNRIVNNETGLVISFSELNSVKENDFQNIYYNLVIYSSKNNRIENNIIKNASQINLLLTLSDENEIILNNFIDGRTCLTLSDSSNNLIIKNKISQCYYGIKFGTSFGKGTIFNKIYLNDFINNTKNFLKTESEVIKDNIFNSPEPISYFYKSKNYKNYLGNYWLNYQGKDENNDGIGDTPYQLNSEEDKYPLIEPWEIYFQKINLPKILISEVYYNVLLGTDPDNEWIILHNLENKEIDLSEWSICSQSTTLRCNILYGIIPSQGFVILTPTTTTLNYWKIPKEINKIILGKRIGSYGLRNEGDNLILKNKEGNVIDSLSYGDDISILNPPCLNVRKGKSLLRYPPEQDTDTAADFIESEPTISNKSPVPFIIISPPTPIKGIKVNFNASQSIDPDGEISSFYWQIKNTSTFEILASSTATTTFFTFFENGKYEINLTVIDNDGATSSTSTILKVEPFSFAIITDLHIGRHYREEYQGEDYYLTERLKNVVKWVNENKDKTQCENEICFLKFIAILGDITENTSLSGFCKTKEILDQLEIPYIPVFGNHDVGTDEEYEQCSKWKGQDYFDQVFWSTSSIPCQNATSAKNFEILLKEFNFQRDEKNRNYKDFSFNYGGINFIGLDFVSREKFMKIGPGVGSDAVLNEINKNWLKEKSEELKDNPTILLAHHPFIEDPINAFSVFTGPLQGEYEILLEILRNAEIIIDFGGHIHSFEKAHGKLPQYANANKKYDPIFNTQVFTTEALMVGSNGRGIEEKTIENGVVDSKKGIIRIVKIFERNVINPNNWETTETGDEFLSFNPYFNFGFSLRQYLGKPCIELEGGAFCDKNIKPYTILWNFGDGEIKEGIQEYTKCYGNEGKYKITFILKDKNSDFSEYISKEVEIREGIIPKTIKRTQEQIEKGIRFFSEKSQMFFDKIGETGGKIKTWILKEKSEPKPIGVIDIDFDKLQGDLELENLIADTDIDKRKSIFYMPQWPNEVKRSKILFVPKK